MHYFLHLDPVVVQITPQKIQTMRRNSTLANLKSMRTSRSPVKTTPEVPKFDPITGLIFYTPDLTVSKHY